MLLKFARLFVIKNRLEASAVIYALALGAAARGRVYLGMFPGTGGKLLYFACLATVLLAGSKIFDCLGFERTTQAGE